MKEDERLEAMSGSSDGNSNKNNNKNNGALSKSMSGGSGRQGQGQGRASDNASDVVAVGARDAAAEHKLHRLGHLRDQVAEERDPALFLPHALHAPVLLGGHAALCGGKNNLASTLAGGGKLSVTAADDVNATSCCCIWWEVKVASLRSVLSASEFDSIVAICAKGTAQAGNCFANLFCEPSVK